MSGNSHIGTERWQAIAAVAAKQHGNVTRAQLLGLGCNDNAIRHQTRLGRLFRVHRGVYAVGRRPVVVLERAAAAVLACGPGAALSHGSALALWELAPWPARFEVTVTRHREPRGITVHRYALHRRDVTTQRGIRVTTPARTVLDCTPRLSDDDLTRAVNDARHKRLSSPAGLADQIERSPRHPGVCRLRPFAATRQRATRSRFEDRFGPFCARYGLPTPTFNAIVCGFEVDALFAPERVIVELDSWEFHRDHAAFVNDRRRDAVTLAAGYATVRITWERLDAAEAERLTRILQARR